MPVPKPPGDESQPDKPLDAKEVRKDLEQIKADARQSSQTLDRLAQLPLNKGQTEAQGVKLSTNDTSVPHGLGRRPKGWFVVRKSGPGDVYEGSDPRDPNSTINLRVSSGTITVSLIFF